MKLMILMLLNFKIIKLINNRSNQLSNKDKKNGKSFQLILQKIFHNLKINY